MTTKVLLTSDLHLGQRNDTFIDNREQRLSTFRKIAAMAGRYDILLIAGHLIDEGYTDSSLLNIIKKEFSAIAENGTEIFYTTARGEFSDHNIIEDIEKIHGVTIFNEGSKSSSVKSKKGNIFVHGIQPGTKTREKNPHKNREGGFHLGLFHADFTPQFSRSKEGCINKEDIRELNLHFYALGKSHNFKMFKSMNRIIGAYAGSPEPCCFDEPGDRYVISMEVENDQLSQIKRIPVNNDNVTSCQIDCTSVSNYRELLLRIKAMEQTESIYNIVLCGIRGFNIEQDFNSELKDSFRGLRIVNQTIPSLEIQADKFRDLKTLKGEFFRSISDMIENDKIPREIDKNILTEILNQGETTAETGGEVLFCTF